MNSEIVNFGHLSTLYHTNFILLGNKDLSNDLQKKINWRLFGTGPLMVEAFKKNKLDMGYMGLPPAIIGIDQGVPIKCVAGGHVEGTIMVSNKKFQPLSKFNGDISRILSQFQGKIIGTPSQGSIHDAILKYYLEKYDLQDQIEVKNYNQAEFIALDMKNNIIDAGVGTPALAVFANSILDSQIIIPSKYLLPNNPSYGIFFHDDIVINQPEIVLKFLKHHKRASFLLRESKAKSAEIISQTLELLNNNQRYIMDVLKISPKYCIALSEGYLNSTKGFIKTLHRLGYISRIIDINEIFNFEFLRDIHPENDHYILPTINDGD